MYRKKAVFIELWNKCDVRERLKAYLNLVILKVISKQKSKIIDIVSKVTES